MNRYILHPHLRTTLYSHSMSIQIRMHMHIHMRIHTHIHVHMHMHTHVCTWVSIDHARSCVICVHMHMHIHIHTHIHIHMHIRVYSRTTADVRMPCLRSGNDLACTPAIQYEHFRSLRELIAENNEENRRT